MKYFNEKVFKQARNNKMLIKEEVFVEFYKVFKILAETSGSIFWGTLSSWMSKSVLESHSDNGLVENNHFKLQIKTQ